MQETLRQTADAEDYIRQRKQESLYQITDARDSISDSGCMSLFIRKWMQDTLYVTADAGVIYQTADAKDSISDSGYRSLVIRQRMQETISDS